MGLCLSSAGRGSHKRKVKVVGLKSRSRRTKSASSRPVSNTGCWKLKSKAPPVDESPENYGPAEAASGYLSVASDLNFSKISRVDPIVDDHGNLYTMHEEEDHQSPMAKRHGRNSKGAPNLTTKTRRYARRMPSLSQFQNLAAGMGKTQTEFGARPPVMNKNENLVKINGSHMNLKTSGQVHPKTRRETAAPAASTVTTFRSILVNKMGDSSSTMNTHHVAWTDVDNQAARTHSRFSPNQPADDVDRLPATKQFSRGIATGSSNETRAEALNRFPPGPEFNRVVSTGSSNLTQAEDLDRFLPGRQFNSIVSTSTSNVTQAEDLDRFMSGREFNRVVSTVSSNVTQAEDLDQFLPGREFNRVVSTVSSNVTQAEDLERFMPGREFNRIVSTVSSNATLAEDLDRFLPVRQFNRIDSNVSSNVTQAEDLDRFMPGREFNRVVSTVTSNVTQAEDLDRYFPGLQFNRVVSTVSSNATQAEDLDRFLPSRQFKRIISTASSNGTEALPRTDHRIAAVAAAVVVVDGHRIVPEDDNSIAEDFSCSTAPEKSMQKVVKSYRKSAAMAAKGRGVFKTHSENDRSLSVDSRNSLSPPYSPRGHASLKFNISRDLSGTYRRGESHESGGHLINRPTTSNVQSLHGSRLRAPEQQQQQLPSRGKGTRSMRDSLSRSSGLQYMIEEDEELENSMEKESEMRSEYPPTVSVLHGTRMESSKRTGLKWKSTQESSKSFDVDRSSILNTNPDSLSRSGKRDSNAETGADYNFTEYHSFRSSVVKVRNSVDTEGHMMRDRLSALDGEMITTLPGRPSVSYTYFNSCELSCRLSCDSVSESLHKEPSVDFERSSSIFVL